MRLVCDAALVLVMTAAWRGGLVAALLALAATVRAAGPLTPAEVPEPLRPWTAWVLRGHEARQCPLLHGADDRRCVWPSHLSLQVDEAGGRFTHDWLALSEGWAALPGGGPHWPEGVTVDGRPAAVTGDEVHPRVRLTPGLHRVAGTIAWTALPEILPIPADTGLVTLTLRGVPVLFPHRDPPGQLWLERRPPTAEAARLEVVVHRRVADGVPVRLTTRIEIRVAGQAREVELGPPLPPGFVPMALTSPLPARLQSDGRLRLQVQPGTWRLELEARHDGPARELRLPVIPPPWDRDEVWVFQADPTTRVVTVGGVPAVDPAQTELPDDWRTLPAYLVSPDATMALVEKRRGDADPGPDRLTLERTWWLDFDGGGFTVRDVLSGTLSRSWRLEMAPPTTLGRVTVDGEPRLITRRPGESASGIELRRREVTVEAESRVEGRVGTTPATGWQHDFQQMSGTLHLPPGWRLIRASGADDVSSSWLTDWTLLDLFIVLLVATAAGRLFGPRWGTLALLTLGLTHHEPGAPGTLWLPILAGIALVEVIPTGRLRSVVRGLLLAAVVALLLVVVPFMLHQVRQGIWPALERPAVAVGEKARQPASAAGGLIDSVASPADRMARYAAKSRVVAEEAYRPRPPEFELDPSAQLTTGPGLPDWQWRQVRLGWRGPVEHTQVLSLWLVSPRMNLVLAVLRVALLAALVLLVLRAAAPAWRGTGPTTAALLVLALVGAVPVTRAHADVPPKEMLDELRERLLAPPTCHPECAAFPRAELDAGPDTLRLRLEVDAAAATGVPLPGGAKSWSPRTVRLDDGPAPGLARDPTGVLWLQVTPGRHRVLLEGPIPPAATSLDVPFPFVPRHLAARAAGWRVTGLREGRLVGDTLRLARLNAEAGGETLHPGTLPPFLQVTRTLRLGLSLEAETTVARVTPADSPVVVSVPLLSGESVTTPGVRVENGQALVTLGPGTSRTAWRSILDEATRFTLVAPVAEPWAEVWRLHASPIWHVAVSGIPEVHQDSPDAREWRPWPGEQVTVTITRPVAVEGPTRTIDETTLTVSPGLRATDATLAMVLRSSRGGEHVIRLPPDADLQSLSIDGQPQPIRQDGGQVTVPIVPGRQALEVVWREPRGIRLGLSTPAVDAGAPSVNARLRISVPRDRWILFTSGGLAAPAVLFWSELAVLALVALALGRIRTTPLRARHWFLLGIGLTQVHVGVAALVAGWLLLLGWRRRHGAALGGRRFDLLQVALGALTLVAFIALVAGVRQGLLGLPAMQIAGGGSSGWDLRWFHDRAATTLPSAWVLSVPLLAYRVAMLAWALWLAWAFVAWLRWGWTAFTTGGAWRPVRRR